MIHVKFFDIDGILWWEQSANQLPKVGLTFSRNGRILRVVEVDGNNVTVMEREN